MVTVSTSPLLAGARQQIGRAWQGPVESLVAIVVAMAVGGGVLLATGHDPVEAYRVLIQRTLLRPAGPEEILVRTTPLLMVGPAVLVATRAGLWNIGIDGQVLVGGLAAAAVGTHLDGVPRPLLWLGAAVAGLAAGAAWVLVPAVLRSRFNVNEIVTTIMFNYVALSLTAWLVKGPLGDRSVVSPQTERIPVGMRLATLGDTRVHIGLIVAIGLVAMVGFVARATVLGFGTRVVGANPRAARHGLIPVGGYLVGALLASGALAGLAGANDILSTKGTFQADWNPEYGLPAFALVFLARQNIAAVIPAALLFGLISYGADVMPRAAGIDPAFFALLEGTLLVSLAVSGWLHRRRTVTS